ncbi:hypothetical protein AB751O23_AB_00160 [Chlamydiales bacterium SCGC AB-751-O23]|jgi:uncharacterized protein|nr:hypothetical protein AB751O23_AB_00160 [Chlamydiales bacterium SCGC AB-751-O23]
MSNIKKLTVKGESVDFVVKNTLHKIGLQKKRVMIRILQKEYHGIFQNNEAIVCFVYDEEESTKSILKKFKKDLSEEFKLKIEDEIISVQVTGSFYDTSRLKSEVERDAFLRDYLEKRSIRECDEEGLKQIVWNPEAQHNFVQIKQIPTEPLTDSGANIHIQFSEDQLKAEAIIFFNNQQAKEEDIFRVLKKHQCIKGVIRKNIQEVIKNKTSEYFEIARGTLPVNDRPASVEFFFRNKDEKDVTRLMEALTVDVRNVKDISIAEKNQLLVRVGDIIPGIDGYTVKGTSLKKKDLNSACPLKLGNGVYLSENGSEVYSKAEGHILWDEDELFIDVESIYMVNGNVDFSQGNINGFVGKVVISGSVKPKFSVTAEGDIEIQGDVEDAYVESTQGNVTIQGTIVHQNEGYIKAAETFTGVIASNAKIYAKNIVIEKQVFNSYMKAEESIEILGTPGVIVGGTTFANRTLKVNTIGSESWITTEVHVGDVTELKSKVRILTQRTMETEDLIKETRKVISMLKILQQNGQLNDMQNAQLEENSSKLEVLQKDLERDSKEKEKLKVDIEKCKKALLEVNKTLYPQVSVYIFDSFFMPKKEEEHLGMICRNSLIKRFPL